MLDPQTWTDEPRKRALPATPRPEPEHALPRVVVIEPDPGLRRRYAEELAPCFEVHGVAREGRAGLELARVGAVDAVVVHQHLPDMDGLEVIRRLTERMPEVRCLLTSPLKDTDLLRKALSAGARDYLVAPLEPFELVTSLRSALGIETALQVIPEPPIPEVPGAGIWCFNGPMGGVGQTSLVCATAGELAERGHRVAVVDLDLFFGDVAFYLDLPQAGPHLGTLLHESLDEAPAREYLPDYASSHPAGFDVFLGPREALEISSLDRHRLVDLILRLPEVYDHVLLDMPAGIDDLLLPLLDAARFHFVLGDERLSGVKKLRGFLQLLQRIGTPLDRVHPVLSRVDSRDHRRLDYLRTLEELGTPILHSLPRNRRILEEAVRSGQPAGTSAPRSPYARGVRRLLDDMLGFHASEEERRTRPGGFWLSRLRGTLSSFFF